MKDRNGLAVIDMNMSGNKFFNKTCILIIAAVIVIAAVWYTLWTRGCFLPKWIKWESGTCYDQSGQYEILLARRKIKVKYNDTVIWTLPEGVKVQKVLSCDIDNDQKDELILLCWKVGRYGIHKPFWVKKDERKWSQHIFVYEYENDTIRPKWTSSYIGQDVTDMAVGSDTDSLNRLFLTDPDGKISCWIWDSWGFTKEEKSVTFTVFGDNIIHEPIYRFGINNDESFGFLFENLEDVISESDVSIINQETPLVYDPSMYSDYPRFGTPVGVGQAIVDAGFDVVTCATNHALDKGTWGIEFTRNFFEANNIMCLGIQSEDETDYAPYQILEKNGIRFALLNYTYGTNGIRIPDENPNMVHLLEDEARIRTDIEEAKADADFVIVFAHWGTEDSAQIDDFQRKWSQVFLEEKVDVVIGTHPHVIQPYEILTGENGHQMLIYYSIGNYISAQPEKSCVKGGMASFTVMLTQSGYAVTEYELQPLSITWQEGGSYTVSLLTEYQYKGGENYEKEDH